MGKCGGMAAYVMAIVLLVALFVSSAKCRPEPLGEDKASGSNGGGNAMVLNSTAASVNGGSGSGDVKLEWCPRRNCVKEGLGNVDCYCCAATPRTDLPACYDTVDQCHDNCV